MASHLAEVFVSITGNAAPLHRELAGVKASLMGMSRVDLAPLMLGLAAAGAVAGVGLYKAFQSASELNATLSKTKVIFGDAAGEIIGLADEMAKKFGQSKSEYLSAAASFGAVFKGMGKSQKESAALGNQIAQLGMDMASFERANTTNADAFTALSAALRGEMDPIEKFRVFLNADKIEAEALALGVAKTKSEITDAAKKTAILNLILKQTMDVQGDLARTANDPDNQFKKLTGTFSNLAGTIGQQLMPAFNVILGAGNSILAEFSGW
jgi:hypothetical protein